MITPSPALKADLMPTKDGLGVLEHMQQQTVPASPLERRGSDEQVDEASTAAAQGPEVEYGCAKSGLHLWPDPAKPRLAGSPRPRPIGAMHA